MIDTVITSLLASFSGFVAQFVAVLPTFALRPVLHLCVSDANKEFLAQNSELLILLTEALLLDPEHVRQNQATDTKAALQCDAVDCCLHLALYPAGKEMLAKAPALMECLHALAEPSGQAFTEEARVSAHGVRKFNIPSE